MLRILSFMACCHIHNITVLLFSEFLDISNHKNKVPLDILLWSFLVPSKMLQNVALSRWNPVKSEPWSNMTSIFGGEAWTQNTQRAGHLETGPHLLKMGDWPGVSIHNQGKPPDTRNQKRTSLQSPKEWWPRWYFDFRLLASKSVRGSILCS